MFASRRDEGARGKDVEFLSRSGCVSISACLCECAAFRPDLALVCLDRRSVTPDLMFSGNESNTPADIQFIRLFKSQFNPEFALCCTVKTEQYSVFRVFSV